MKNALIGIAPIALLAAIACGEAAKEVEEVVDCAQMCGDYDQCVDTDFDVTDCTSDCEEKSDEDNDYRDRADACAACLDDKACAESFPCVDECAGVLPPS